MQWKHQRLTLISSLEVASTHMNHYAHNYKLGSGRERLIVFSCERKLENLNNSY